MDLQGLAPIGVLVIVIIALAGFWIGRARFVGHPVANVHAGDSSDVKEPLVDELQMPELETKEPPKASLPALFAVGLNGGSADVPEYVGYIRDLTPEEPNSNGEGGSLHILTGLPIAAQRLVEVVPDLLDVLRQGKAVDLFFSPEAAQLIASGKAEMMVDLSGQTLPIIRDATTKQVIEIGRIGEPGHGSWIPSPTKLLAVEAAFQVLAAVTLQYYLTQITAKLDRILSGVEEILEKLRAQAWSKLHSAEVLIDQVTARISSGKANRNELLQMLIPGFERGCDVMFEARHNIERFAGKLAVTKQSPRMSRDLLDKFDVEFRPDLQMYYESARVLAKWFQTALALDAMTDPDGIETRKADLEKIARHYAETQGVIESIARGLQEAAESAVKPDGPFEGAGDAVQRVLEGILSRDVRPLTDENRKRLSKWEDYAGGLIQTTKMRMLPPAVTEKPLTYRLQLDREGRAQLVVRNS